MSVRTRVVVGGILAATAIAVPVAALASGSGSPVGKPAPSATNPAPSANKPAPPPAKTSSAPSALGGLAASAGISKQQLLSALQAAKRVGGNNSAGVAAFVAAAHVPTATAQRIVAAAFGSSVDRSTTGPAAVAILSRRLGVSASAARAALQRISALSGPTGVDPSGATFAAIAHDLGVTPAQLAAGLDAVKQSLAGR